MSRVFRLLRLPVLALALGAASASAQTTVFAENYTGGSSTLTYANLASVAAHGVATDSVLGEAYRIQANNLSAWLVLLPSAVSLAQTGDYVRLTFDFRSESNSSGHLRFGLFNSAGTVYSSANGDDHGYYADFGSTQQKAWYATGGPAYFLTLGTPVVSNSNPTFPQLHRITTTAAVPLQLQVTRTSAGATFTVHRGTTLIYSLDHTSPVTSFDEFAIFTQSARTYWVDNLTLTTGTAIPEPGTSAALAGALGLIFVGWRRRRAN
jgi:hypothetical protein